MKIEKRIFSVEEKKKIREFILTNGDKMTNEQMYIAQNINCMQQAGIIVGMKTSKLIPNEGWLLSDKKVIKDKTEKTLQQILEVEFSLAIKNILKGFEGNFQTHIAFANTPNGLISSLAVNKIS